MRQRSFLFYIFVLLLVSILGILVACTSQKNDVSGEASSSAASPSATPLSEDTSKPAPILPELLDDISASLAVDTNKFNKTIILINMPGCQQTCYGSQDGKYHVVLEVQSEKSEAIDVADQTEIQIGKKDGICFVYHGQIVNYPGLNEYMTSNMQQIEEGDYVLEWEQAGFYCRIFGNLTEEELVQLAEGADIIKVEGATGTTP